jgi:hypothetical protein
VYFSVKKQTRVLGMIEVGKESLKGIKIRQPRAERSVALGPGSVFPRALKGHYLRPYQSFCVEPLQGWGGEFSSPGATLRFAPGYRMCEPFRLFGKTAIVLNRMDHRRAFQEENGVDENLGVLPYGIR